jgi:hypothetical protein
LQYLLFKKYRLYKAKQRSISLHKEGLISQHKERLTLWDKLR